MTFKAKTLKTSPGAVLIVCIITILMVGARTNHGSEIPTPIVNEDSLKQFNMARKFYEKGLRQYFSKNYEMAGKTLQKSVDEFPAFSQAHFYLSQVYYKQKEFLAALRAINEAKKSFKGFVEFLQSARHYYNKHLHDERRDMDATIFNLEQALHVANCYQVRALLRAIEDTEERKRDLDHKKVENTRMTKAVPADYYYFHGNILYRMKNYSGAARQYLVTIKLDRKHERAYNNLISLFYSARKYLDALQYIKLAEDNGVQINVKLHQAVRQAANSNP